jgi:hypothetical protein|eukprot:COSAG06_NODE_1841_length_8237_cov_11.146965_9_plen_78_part_00
MVQEARHQSQATSECAGCRSLNGGKRASNRLEQLCKALAFSQQKRRRRRHSMTLRGGFEVTRRMVDAQSTMVHGSGE